MSPGGVGAPARRRRPRPSRRAIRAAAQRRARRRRILRVAIPIGLVVAVGAFGLYRLTRTDHRSDRTGSELVVAARDVDEPLKIAETPQSYEIYYRLVDTSADAVVITTDHVRIRRPFEARIRVLTGAPPGDHLQTERMTRFARLGTIGNDGDWTLFAVPPAIAGSDLRPEPVLDDAVAAGTVEVREQREVLGRRCQVYRFGNNISAGNLEPYEVGADTYADACFDEAGLLLEEVWVLDGKRVQRRLATDVRTGVDLDDDLFHPKDAKDLPFDEGGGSVRQVAADSAPEDTEFFVLDSPPEGFIHMGRYSIVPARLEAFRDPTNPEDRRGTASVSDVWVRGADLLVVDQGFVTAPGGELGEHPQAREVDLGPLGTGTAFADLRTSEVRATVPGGSFLRVYGTLDLDELVPIASSLRVTTGTGLVFVEE